LTIHTPRRRAAEVLVVVIAAVLIALATAAPAGAHAVLVETQPGNGTLLERWPDRVLLRFNEPVDASLGALRVYDSDATRVDSGRTSRPDSQTVAIELDDEPLARGTYTVAWRIVSADSHPLHGAFVFSVKSKSGTAGVIDQLLKDDEVPQEVSVGFTVTRFLSFALLLACIGGALVLFAVFRGIKTPVRRTLHWVLGALAIALAALSLVGIVFQGASAGGFGLGDAFSWDVFSAVLDTRFGEVWLVRAGLAAGLGLVALSRVHPGYLLPFAVGLAWTPPAAGHANTAGPLAFAMDMLHVLAGSVWAGGLSFVLLALILAGADRWPLAAAIVPRFSVLAVGSVAVLLVGGIVNGYLEVRTWSGLWETNYGRLLLAKAAIVLFLLGLGAYNNRYAVPRLKQQVASVKEQRRFLRAAGVEVALFVAAIGVTAVLVAEPPAKASVAPSGPVVRSAQVGPFELNVVVDPAEKGPNNIHLYLLKKNGQPAKVAEATVAATLPDPGIGPLELESHPAGPGHYSVLGASLPLAGDWDLDVGVRRGEFEHHEVTLSIPIRKG
jgi:copper transport protein